MMRLKSNHIQSWVRLVDFLEGGEFTEDDWLEFVKTISARLHIGLVWDALDNQERTVVSRADERFVKLAGTALRKAGLLDKYLHVGKKLPADQWWWHISE